MQIKNGIIKYVNVTRWKGNDYNYDGTRYLTLFASIRKIWCYSQQSQITYKSESSITYNFSHYFTKIKVDSYDSLPTEQALTLHNVIVLVKSDKSKIKINTTIRVFQENTGIS